MKCPYPGVIYFIKYILLIQRKFNNIYNSATYEKESVIIN